MRPGGLKSIIPPSVGGPRREKTVSATNAASTATPEQLRAFILAGGRSSRFGSDKALHEIDGVPMILHVARAVSRPAAPGVTVVADSAGKYEALGLRTVADPEPFQGPLSGILTALRDAADAERILICSCDLIGLKPGWLEMLASEALGTGTAPPLAVAFRAEEIEPFPGIYHSAAESPVAGALARGEGSPAVFLARLGRLIPAPADWRSARNINRRSDLSS